MKFRGIVLLVGSILLAAVAFAQNPGSEELPSAPSAVQQQRSKPKPAPPAPPPASAQPQTSTTAAEGEPQSTSAPAEPPAAKAGAAQANPPAGSQQPQDSIPPNDPTATITKTVNEVNVVFTVTDRHGRYVKNLAKTDFSVLDDSKPSGQIRSFHAETDLPLQVGLMVDASNSVRDRFKFEQESAIEFLNQTVRPRYDKAFIVGFDVTPEVTQDFTDNTEALSRGVRALRPGGGTAMYRCAVFACRDKLLKAPRYGPVRRAIILLSDGDDNMSHVTREEAIEMALRAEVIVYSISTNITGAPGIAGTECWSASPTPPADALSFLSNLTTWPTPLSKSRMSCAASTRFPTIPPTCGPTAVTTPSKSWRKTTKAFASAVDVVTTRPPSRPLVWRATPELRCPKSSALSHNFESHSSAAQRRKSGTQRSSLRFAYW